jgi:signal transduction histidine kinase
MSNKQYLNYTFEHKQLNISEFKCTHFAKCSRRIDSERYDADAKNVVIILRETDSGKSITVYDDGTGMTFSDVNEKFLRIGRNRRHETGNSVQVDNDVLQAEKFRQTCLFGIASELISLYERW